MIKRKWIRLLSLTFAVLTLLLVTNINVKADDFWVKPTIQFETVGDVERDITNICALPNNKLALFTDGAIIIYNLQTKTFTTHTISGLQTPNYSQYANGKIYYSSGTIIYGIDIEDYTQSIVFNDNNSGYTLKLLKINENATSFYYVYYYHYTDTINGETYYIYLQKYNTSTNNFTQLTSNAGILLTNPKKIVVDSNTVYLDNENDDTVFFNFNHYYSGFHKITFENSSLTSSTLTILDNYVTRTNGVNQFVCNEKIYIVADKIYEYDPKEDTINNTNYEFGTENKNSYQFCVSGQFVYYYDLTDSSVLKTLYFYSNNIEINSDIFECSTDKVCGKNTIINSFTFTDEKNATLTKTMDSTYFYSPDKEGEYEGTITVSDGKVSKIFNITINVKKAVPEDNDEKEVKKDGEITLKYDGEKILGWSLSILAAIILIGLIVKFLKWL